AMNDAMVVEVGHPRADATHPAQNLLFGHAVGVALDDRLERLARHVLHDDPLVSHGVGAEVVDGDQVGVLEIEAVSHAPHLDIEIAADELEGDLFTGVARGEVNLAESAATDSTLDGIAVERFRAAGVDKPWP